MRILLTGGTGNLGKCLKNKIVCYAPLKEELDIIKKIRLKKNPDLIIHCAAYTDLLGAEKNKKKCYLTNVIGTRNIASLKIPMIYISTEYIFDGEKGNYSEEEIPNPLNFYSLTKLLGEYESRATRSVVVRCLFKPNPFPHKNAFMDQITSGCYVDTMAEEIKKVVTLFSKIPPTIHIGFEPITTFELAKKTRKVNGVYLSNFNKIKLPKNTSLNSNKWKGILNENRFC